MDLPLFTSEGRWLRRRRADDGAVIWERECVRAATSLSVLPDESRLVTGHDDGAVVLWTLDDCRCMVSLRASRSWISALVADPDGHWLAAADSGAMVTVFRAEAADEPFESRLARADTMAAMWLDESLHRQFMVRRFVQKAIDADSTLAPSLRSTLLRLEAMRPAVNWEAAARALDLARDPGQPRAVHEHSLRIAEATLAENTGCGIVGLAAGFAALRLQDPDAALRYAARAVQDEPNARDVQEFARAIRAMALWQQGRCEEARAELAALEAAFTDTPNADQLRLLAEVRRMVAR